jgi:hypothetical protein
VTTFLAHLLSPRSPVALFVEFYFRDVLRLAKGEWKAQISLRVRQAFVGRASAVAEREKRKLRDVGKLTFGMRLRTLLAPLVAYQSRRFDLQVLIPKSP